MVRLPAHPEERATDNRFAEIILSSLRKLRHAIVSSTADESEVPFLPRHILGLTTANATRTHPTFALRDERLIVGPAKGLIPIYDLQQLLSPGSEAIQPLKATLLSSVGAVRQLLANPEGIPELVAVRRDVAGSADALAVELSDVNKLDISGGWRSGETQGTTPASSTFIDISPTERSILTYHSTNCPGLPKANNSQLGYNREKPSHLLLQVL